jgi:hypothetical protein
MTCQICGEEGHVKAYVRQRQVLCRACAARTPAKVSRAAFEAAYWGDHVAEVPLGTRREFYSDYVASTYDVSGYIAATVFPA